MVKPLNGNVAALSCWVFLDQAHAGKSWRQQVREAEQREDEEIAEKVRKPLAPALRRLRTAPCPAWCVLALGSGAHQLPVPTCMADVRVGCMLSRSSTSYCSAAAAPLSACHPGTQQACHLKLPSLF